MADFTVDIPELGEDPQVKIQFDGSKVYLVAKSDRGEQVFSMERYSEMPVVIRKVAETFGIATTESDEVGRLNEVVANREESIGALRDDLAAAQEQASTASEALRSFAQRVDDLYDRQYQVYTAASSFDDSMDELKREMQEAVGSLANVS